MQALLMALVLALPPAAPPAQFPPSARLSGDVREAYTKLQAEFSTALAEYQKAVEAEKANPSGTKPERPHKRFAPRFAEVGRAGHPRAARWCLDNIGDAAGDEAARRELILACHKVLLPEVLWAERQEGKNSALVVCAPNDLLRSINGASGVLGREQARALCDELFEKVALPESKAQALATQATIELAGKQPDASMPAAARELYERLAKDFADTDSGKRATGLLFRIDHLAIGMSVPDVETQDVEGVAFKLSDYRGKVVVLDFWGFW